MEATYCVFIEKPEYVLEFRLGQQGKWPKFSYMLNLHLMKTADGRRELVKESIELLQVKEDESGYLSVSFVRKWYMIDFTVAI